MSFGEMQIGKTLFYANILELNSLALLVRVEQADSITRKNVVIGDPRECSKDPKVLPREVVLEKSNDGQENLKVTIKSLGLYGQIKSLQNKQKRWCPKGVDIIDLKVRDVSSSSKI